MLPRVEDLFHELADLSDEDRRRYFADHAIDARIRNEVEELLAFDSDLGTSIEGDIGELAQQALLGMQAEGLCCGPYRLGELLGRGGVGAVYKAERVDGEVRQQVAVKLLRPGADDAPVRQRFLAERQILANLSHPHIARLLDAGHRPDGQPYLVMEYVEGTTIDAYTRGLPVRQKVALFLKVCDAVSYLHRNLVVHRDLKPANVLVTAGGEPKLLDFGIAKILELTNDSTATSMRMLTPEYASPEQVAGGPITTATDVYSLGAVLYKLLTGVCPHQFDGDSAAAVALAIVSGTIAPPSKLAPDVKGDLELVVMKALRKEPEDRYASVETLADDLRACLEWRPVRARSGNVWYRTRRWVRRYWLPVAAAALVIASLSAGLYVANRQRRAAERRFAQLRQLSNRVIDVDRSIRTLPGSIDARRRLVSASLEYLEGLSQDARGDLDLAEEISDGYWRMARIQGVNTELNLGDSQKAEECLKKANDLVETVLNARPDDRGALFRTAVISHDRMVLADTEERRADSLEHARRSIEQSEAFLRHDDPQHPVRLDGFLRSGAPRDAEQYAIATFFSNIALTYVHLHLYPDGIRYALRAVELADAVPFGQDIASGALSIVANAQRYEGDLSAALRTIRQAKSLSEQATYPDETARLFNQFGPMFREGLILGEKDAINLDRPAEAIHVLQQALDMAEETARKDASDSASRARVGMTARALGDILRDRDPRRALAVYELGIRRLEETPNSLKARRDRAQLLAKSAYALRRLHRSAEARPRIEAALAILKDTHDYPMDRVRPGSHSHTVIGALADEEAEDGNPRRALEIYEELLGKLMSAQLNPQESLPDAVVLSQMYAAIAELSRRTGAIDRASATNSLREELWGRWDAKLPDNPFIHRQIAVLGKF